MPPPLPRPRHRRCVPLTGDRARTRESAAALVAPLAAVLWISRSEPDALRPSALRRRLGGTVDAVVLDLHDGVEPEVLGQAHGLVRGGGALILRLPQCTPSSGQERLVTIPFSTPDVGERFWTRLRRHLDGLPVPTAPLPQPPPITGGSDEQARVAQALADRFHSDSPTASVLIADRGRGKSSALGMALRQAAERGLRVAVTADSAASATEVVRFSGVAWQPLVALLDTELDVLVIDEAARLPVPVLQALVVRHPRAHLAFASTVRGYEGTGRGFVLRFLHWLADQPRPLARFTLHEPIRWDAGDPLERLVFDVLALDAAPSVAPPAVGPAEAEAVDRDRLAADEGLLRQVFGLLVHAHYRTTPGDLHRMLDAPNLSLHVLRRAGEVVAVTLVAQEGGLSPEQCAALAAGKGRIRGHALPDTFISHGRIAAAGRLRMIRSVRIATHPDLRRQGLARQLVEHVHRTYAPDLFGTMFGATRPLLRFRRSLGYQLVRVGSSRGARTGEPSAVMVRACSDAARELVSALRVELARALPAQLAMGSAVPLESGLVDDFSVGLPVVAPLTLEAAQEAARWYAHGPSPSGVVLHALQALAAEHTALLGEIPDGALLRARLLERRPWRALAAEAGQTVPAIQRRMRRATQSLLARLS